MVIAVLLVRLFAIQIIDDSFKESAENNSMVRYTIYPPRGIIYDRNGEILVGNRICYDIMVTPKEITAFDTLALASALDLDPDWVRSQLKYYREYRSRIGFRTLQFVKQVSAEKYMKFAEHEYDFPGFRGQVRSVREYPFNAGGNLLGYVSEVGPKDMEREPDVYKSGDYMSVDGKGNYTLLGRVDDMVNINGNRIEPAEATPATRCKALIRMENLTRRPSPARI